MINFLQRVDQFSKIMWVAILKQKSDLLLVSKE